MFGNFVLRRWLGVNKKDNQIKKGWNSERSVHLSKVFTVISMVALAAVLIFAPQLVKWLKGFSTSAQKGQTPLFLATLYIGGAIGAVLLVQLFMLLQNISKNQVFLAQNVGFLRGISWCCMFGGLVAVASGIYYFPWALVGLAALFIGLIVRVVKNVFAQALALKEENDYTI